MVNPLWVNQSYVVQTNVGGFCDFAPVVGHLAVCTWILSTVGGADDEQILKKSFIIGFVCGLHICCYTLLIVLWSFGEKNETVRIGFYNF